MDDTTLDKDDNYTATDNPIDSGHTADATPASKTIMATDDVPTTTADTVTNANAATNIDTASKAPEVVDATSASSQPLSSSAPLPLLHIPSLLPLSPKPLLPTSLSLKHSSLQSSSPKPSSSNTSSFKTSALKDPTPGSTSQLPLLPLPLFNLSQDSDYPLGLDSPPQPSSSSNPSSSPNPSLPHPMTAPRTVIDHRFFPHVMDMIIASAPRQALVALRETSKSFSVKIAPYLPTHVYLYHDCLVEEEQRIELRRTWNHPWLWTGDNIVGWPDDDVAIGCDLDVHFPQTTLAALEQTRVLDIVGTVPTSWVHQLNSSFDNRLHTVRNTVPWCHGSPCSPFPADRVVVETWGSGWLGPVRYPPQVRKIVINLRYTPGHSGTNPQGTHKVALGAANYPRLREVTFIFKHDSGPGDGVYLDLQTDMLWATDRITYTLVDALDVPPFFFGVASQRLSEDDFRRHVVECVKQDHEVGHGTPFTESDRAQADQAIRILTKDEYRKTLNPYDFQLEDMEYRPEF